MVVWGVVVTMTGLIGSSAVLVFFEIDTGVKIRYFVFASGEFRVCLGEEIVEEVMRIWVGMGGGRETGALLTSVAYSGAMDMALSVLPWKVIWNLRMTRREKVGVLVAVSMGVL